MEAGAWRCVQTTKIPHNARGLPGIRDTDTEYGHDRHW